MYYDHPVQVRFYQRDWERYGYGIAFHEYVVDGWDGAVFLSEDIIRLAAEDGIKEDNAIVELSWNELKTRIREPSRFIDY